MAQQPANVISVPTGVDPFSLIPSLAPAPTPPAPKVTEQICLYNCFNAIDLHDLWMIATDPKGVKLIIRLLPKLSAGEMPLVIDLTAQKFAIQKFSLTWLDGPSSTSTRTSTVIFESPSGLFVTPRVFWHEGVIVGVLDP